MNGDALFWLVLLFSLVVLNILPYTFKEKFNMPYWLSGILICLIGPLIASITGSVFIKMAHSAGSDGFGAGMAAALIGIVLVANGILYIIGGVIASVGNYVKQRKVNQ